jgi:2-polyprenyl-3-methyl-5-hydroxy-6-metoxy-1,4-benzoquinol methylase
MTKAEIQALIKKFGFHRYGKVNLPYGLSTQGLDREPTKAVVFPGSLAGKSLLDVGSAYGYWSFEAEVLGASKVVGLELQQHRLDYANLFKEIKGSKVEFRKANVVHYHLEEEFDYILMLNVLHHLKHPREVLTRFAPKAKEKFIIEGPMRFKDTTMEAVVDGLFEKVEYLPSSLEGPEKGQRKIVMCEVAC